MTKKQLIILCSLLAAALILPFLAGQIMAGNGHVFGGFLLNPLDGNSYLAKMRIGWEGEWRFRLPYTANPGEGAYLFLFYILLGHLSRITGISLLLMFHLARLLASAFLLYTFYRFISRSIHENIRSIFGLIMILAVFGSGLGWIAGLFGAVTSDFWVAEAYPFLSMYANPHFPLGMGLMLVYLDLMRRKVHLRWAPALIVLGAVTGVIQPFVIVVSAVLTAAYLIWDWWETKQMKVWAAVSFLAGGGALLLYQYFAIVNDPVLSIWNAQNITASPPLWDILIALSPALILTIVGLVALIRSNNASRYKLFAVWLIAGALLVYFPFSLQRRFLLGYFIPCAVLGGMGLAYITSEKLKLQKILTRLVIAVSVLTNVFVLTGGILASINQDPRLSLMKDEKTALDWMAANPDLAGLTLASEQSGLFIPAYSGWRVLYGHPFETVDANQRRAEIGAIFSGSESLMEIMRYMSKEGVVYVFWGPRERANLEDNPFASLDSVYQNPTVTIYSTGASH